MKTSLRLLVSVAALVHVYNCEGAEQGDAPPDLSAEKKIFDSVERNQPKEVDYESLPLFKLDEELQKELKNPKPLDVSFEVKLDVLKKLVEYEKHIKVLYEGVQKNIKSALQMAEDLLVQDGPKFLREEFDEENLKKIYNWDDGNVEHFRDLFKDIKTVYHNISDSLKEKPSPLKIFFSKQRNSYA